MGIAGMRKLEVPTRALTRCPHRLVHERIEGVLHILRKLSQKLIPGFHARALIRVNQMVHFDVLRAVKINQAGCCGHDDTGQACAGIGVQDAARSILARRGGLNLDGMDQEIFHHG